VAVWLREVEWLCAEAAQRVPVGGCSTEELAALADALDKVAYAVRVHAGLIVPGDPDALPAGR
jgi:hypothetical protein